MWLPAVLRMREWRFANRPYARCRSGRVKSAHKGRPYKPTPFSIFPNVEDAHKGRPYLINRRKSAATSSGVSGGVTTARRTPLAVYQEHRRAVHHRKPFRDLRR